MPIDDARFRLAMSHFASGVTVVTTSHDGTAFGMTVASFASLSLHPPLVLVCIETIGEDARRHRRGRQVRRQYSQQRAGGHLLEVRFAQRRQIHRRRVVPGEMDVPLIAGALTAIECRVHDRLPGGDHTIFIGEVVEDSHHARAIRCSTSAAAIARCETDAADARHAAHRLPARAAAPQPAQGNAARHSRSHPRLSLRHPRQRSRHHHLSAARLQRARRRPLSRALHARRPESFRSRARVHPRPALASCAKRRTKRSARERRGR